MDIVSLIKKHLNNRLRAFETTEIAMVEAVDYTTWTCSVRPKARVDVRGDVQDMPQIMDVPIAVPKAGESVIMLPIVVGDVGTVIFSKHALDNLLIDKNTTEITIPRSFDINDAIYIGGVFTGIDTIPPVAEGETLILNQSGSYIKFFENGTMTIYGNGNMLIQANGNMELKADRVDING